MFFFGLQLTLFISKNANAPERIITQISTGANTIEGRASKKEHTWSKINSPTYIRVVNAAETRAGMPQEINTFFPSKNEPTKTPTFNPRTMKNRIIRNAEIGETVICPSRQNAVKHASRHRPTNTTEDMLCKTSAFVFSFFPLRINSANP